MNSLVSVIVPVFNAEKYINQTIACVLNQTYNNLEIIVINDGSTDRTPELLDKITDKRLKVFSQENKGASFSKQQGLSQSKGEFIQYLDADDLLSLNKIEDQVIALKKYPDHIALGPTIHFPDGSDAYKNEVPIEWYNKSADPPTIFLTKLYGGSYIGAEFGGMIQPNAFLCPSEIIKKAGPWNTSLSPCPDEDGEYFCRIILASKGIIYTKKAINYYRKFAGGSSLSSIKYYTASSNMLRSTLLKTAHLLAATDDYQAKVAMANQLWSNAFQLYPEFKDLSADAEKKAKEICPSFYPKPFSGRLKNWISGVFGWKFVRKLEWKRAQLTSGI